MKLHLFAKLSKKYKCKYIFFAKSKVCPPTWFFDHIGFITIYNKLLQISTHRRKEGVYLQKNISEDHMFSLQDPTSVDLPKEIEVLDDPTGMENCVDFVAKNLEINNIHFTSQDIIKVMKMGLKEIHSPLKIS